MTDTVINSASVIRGVIPTAGRHRLSCGDAFISSSILTYSAVARVSRSTCTWPPWSRCLSNVDHGRPRVCSLPRIPWNRSSRAQTTKPVVRRRRLLLTRRAVSADRHRRPGQQHPVVPIPPPRRLGGGACFRGWASPCHRSVKTGSFRVRLHIWPPQVTTAACAPRMVVPMRTTGCVVVGGGPAGLTAGAALTGRGVDHVVLECGRIGQSWRTPTVALVSAQHTRLDERRPRWPGARRVPDRGGGGGTAERARCAASGTGGTLPLPNTSAKQVTRHARTRGECRRGGRVFVRRGGLSWPDRRSAWATGTAGGRSRCLGAGGVRCKTVRTRGGHSAGAAGSRSKSGPTVHGGRSEPTAP